MRVPNLITHAPVFLCVKRDGKDVMVGTGFFVGVLSESDPAVEYGYLVTARHCIEKTKQDWPLFVRINRRTDWEPGSKPTAAGLALQAGDAEVIEIENPHWTYHEDETNDVAVLPMTPPPREFLFVVTRPENMATAEVIERESIGIGDELLVVGLFTSHHGRTMNRPIVRAGIIAAMPDEPIEDRDSGLPFDAYLAEIRSIGGLSGSPVWIFIHPGRFSPSGQREARWHFYLLGLIRGHWTKPTEWASDYGATQEEALNTGIAMVTPIQKVLDILGSDDLVAERKRIDRERVLAEKNQR